MNSLKDIIYYLIKNYSAKFKSDLSNARVTKMVYLADWHQAINYKRQLTNIHWFFDNYGPYVADVKNEIEASQDIFTSENTHNFFGNTKIIFDIKNGYSPELSKEAEESIQHIIEVTNALNWNDFIKLVYSTYPIMSSDRYSFLDLVQKASEYEKL